MLLSTIITLQLLLGAPNEITIERVPTPKEVAAFNGVSISVDQEALKKLPTTGTVVIADFPLGTDRSVDLRLQRFEVLMPDAELVVGSINPDGELLQRPIARPNIVLLRGAIEGDPSSRVFIALGEHTSNGLIESEGRTYVLVKDRKQHGTFVYNINDIDPEDMNWIDFQCGVEDIAQPVLANRETRPRNLGGDCIAIQMAIETDYEYTEELFDGDLAASSEYTITLIAAVSSIYISDLNAAMAISFLRLWDNPSDPWDANSTVGQLIEFRDYWQSNMTHVSRHLAHFLTSRHIGGGVAWLNAVCTSYGYGVSASLNGSFPIPLVDHDPNNWDVFVIAHETGHNVGTLHTHDYSPPIDGCGLGDCTDAFGGTIMSYCSGCSGGMTNIVLSYHELVQLVIEDYLANDVSCPLDCTLAIPGACCFQETCFEVTEDACLILEGIYLGSGILCDTGGCEPLLPGACCTDDVGTCIEIDSISCLALDGNFLGTGITCDLGYCDPNAQFACCIGEACTDLTESECNDIVGIWLGIGVTCAADGCEPLDNDFCETAHLVYTGAWDFSTIGALSDDDPFDNEECNTTFLGGVNHDVWFQYTACETSQLLVSTCGIVDFDTDIVVYAGTCESMNQVACNGDGAGCPSFSSELTLDVTEGQTYLIRVGGFSDLNVGSGQIVLGGQLCDPHAPCRSDVNSDGEINVTDLLAIVDHWGESSFEYDIDEDGTVGLGDILLIIAEWGTCED